MLKLILLTFLDYCDNVESGGIVFQFGMFFQIGIGSFYQFVLFRSGNAIESVIDIVFPQFHFHENNGMIEESDDIDFSEAGMKIPVQNFISD